MNTETFLEGISYYQKILISMAFFWYLASIYLVQKYRSELGKHKKWADLLALLIFIGILIIGSVYTG